MESLFTAVFQKTDKWWIAFVEELPGANAQGETIDEARENLKEAVELKHLEIRSHNVTPP
jgi:predicted RNase H-like HicB family nuclease